MWKFLIPIGALIAAAVILFIIFYVRSMRSGASVTLDNIIGEKCIVVERIDNFAGCGMVKVKGCQWSARGVSEDDVFEAGETLFVVAIEGARLVCRKK